MSPATQHAFEPEEVMAYLDGELEPQRAAALAAHLGQCPDCQALAANLHRVSDQLAAWEVGSAPTSLSEEVERAVREPGRAKPGIGDKPSLPGSLLPGWFRLHPWAWGAAGAVVVTMVCMVTYSVRTIALSHVGSEPVAEGGRSVNKTQRAVAASTEQPLPAPPLSAGRAQREQEIGRPRSTHDGREMVDSAEDETEKAGKSEPMIARTASLSIIVKDFGPVQSVVKRITDRYKGYIGHLSTTAPQDAARTLTGTLYIPSPQLEAALAELKQLGRVQQESQSGEEVTKEYTDLAARLKNSRATEQRLLDVLRKNTGKVKDVLEVENEISRVRGEIEQMAADQRALKTRVDFATVQLSLTEDFKASLHVTPPSTMTRLHNAFVDGYHDLVESLISLAVWFLDAGPTLLLWVAILFFPARWIWKRWLRAKLVKTSAASAA
jgi:hypothetical protein